ncbi:hypothetical protein CB0940_01731 [Cercospora beticola]|uniref:Uncharacterized protein n=1 Tax=Cercospora beticola TaxID=122368 RepID=A0A2G5IAC1_CERBT|nr:hypothetical protein CB0940_01731 [Cercospora beticola]PIB01719.1 hypothetical protein CB0940_01731 [Cercospora beticola]WPA97178.1 hypothetical protein RHO25_001787 [Cercospora beticola]
MTSWLRHYGNTDEYRWRREGNVFKRPLGFVEFSFDCDGRLFEGRADMNSLVKLAIKSKLSTEDFRERILLAWTQLRCQHVLLQARTIREKDGLNNFAPQGLSFAVNIHTSVSKAVESAGRHLIFLEDHYEHVNHKDFYMHCQNTSRVVDPEDALAKVFILPSTQEDGNTILRIQFVIAHEIADGISINAWTNNFLKYLNESTDQLKTLIKTTINPEDMQTRLPLPQEALYPKIPGSLARQRWFWAITRILRHVRKPHAAGFANPLRRQQKRTPIPLSPTYSAVLDYRRTLPLNTIPMYISVSAENTARLQQLCREAKASVGAGIYALVAVCMMELYEQREPDIPLNERKCFITGFPLNPRAFFGFENKPDSMMLAFSDGISLPFLSSHLDVTGRLRLLARQAQRQLSAYQKRIRPAGEDGKRQFLTSRGAGLVLANQYLYGIERADSFFPEAPTTNVQGAYPARQNATQQTCGVSSVGRRDLQISNGAYNVAQAEKDFVADFQDLTASVRAREGEFLVGIAGTSSGLGSCPSVDISSLDPELLDDFKSRFENILADVVINEERSRL